MKIRELLSNESKWCKGAHARNALGEECVPYAPKFGLNGNVAKWSLRAAIDECYDGTGQAGEIYIKLLVATNPLSVKKWEKSHTFKEVKELVDRLDV